MDHYLRPKKNGKSGFARITPPLLCAALIITGCRKSNMPDEQGGHTNDDPIAAAMAVVVAQSPATFPDPVTPLPSAGEMDTMPIAELMELAKSWNPALRTQVSNGLAGRGSAIMDELTTTAESPIWQQREVAAEALAAMMSSDARNWRQAFPDIQNRGDVTDAIRQKYAHTESIFIRLANDPHREVRSAALTGFARLQSQSKEAAQAVLQACTDPDEDVANQAMMVFGRQVNPGALEEAQLLEPLSKAMGGELPRAKGDIVRVIANLSEPTQRAFIPVLLAHLDWRATRDTMFASAGQADALRLLTTLQVKELIPRIPSLMHKAFHGSTLFVPSMGAAMAFGKDAESILPELRAHTLELEAQLTAAPRQNEKAAIETNLKKIREAIKHVESL
jgi:HEAT repeat protein